MISTQIIIYFLLLFVMIICDEKFCVRDRKLLLGGVFNYDKTVFAYSWKEVIKDNNKVQLWLVWRFQSKGNNLTEVGASSYVEQLLPGVTIFRAGFGLNLKCESNKCTKFKDLVFVFFNNYYKVFRYVSDEKFAPVADPNQIPWGLKPKGDVSEWYFSSPNMENINGIAFSVKKMQLFMVSKNALYSTSVDVSATGLKWSKISESPQLFNILGGFKSGNDILFNKNESPESLLLKYDQNGKQSEKVSVWKYFYCESLATERSGYALGENDFNGSNASEDKNKKILTILISSIVVAIVLTNIIAAAFWISVIDKKRKSSQS